MALRTVQDATPLAGVALTFTAATASDTLPGGQGVKIIVNNANAGSCAVLLTTPETVEGTLAVADRTVTVPTTQIWEIPVPSRYNDPTTGLATITFTPFTSVTYAVSRGSAAS
jgi:hypothetical protein